MASSRLHLQSLNKNNAAESITKGTKPGARGGKEYAFKHGGTLTPVTKVGVIGTTRVPLKRSRGAKIEEEIMLSRRHNAELADEILELREKIATLSTLENEEDVENSTSVFRKKEVLEIEREILDKEKSLQTKELEVKRKEEAIDAFKKCQKQEMDSEREAVLAARRTALEEGTVLQEDEEVAQGIEHASATSMQRIARGRIAVRSTRRRRILFNASSTKIQSMTRGFFARVFVCEMHRRHLAAIVIQKMLRGRIARIILGDKRAILHRIQAATKVQTIVRMNLGKRRMQNAKTLIKNAAKMAWIASRLSMHEITLLSTTCATASPDSSPPSSVLGLIQIMKLILSSTSTDNTTSVQNWTWSDACSFLQHSNVLLRTLRYRSSIAGHKCLIFNSSGLNLLQAYEFEPTFNATLFMNLPAGRGAATAFFEWTNAAKAVLSVQSEFLFEDETSLPLAMPEDRLEKSQFQPSSNPVYFDPTLLTPALPRTRPVLVLLSRDAPSFAKQSMITALHDALPGFFLHMNQPFLQVSAIQAVLNVGYNVIAEVDIGLCTTQRTTFVQSFESIKAALHPLPLCILVQASKMNRKDNTTFHGVSEKNLKNLHDGDIKRHLEVRELQGLSLYFIFIQLECSIRIACSLYQYGCS